MDEDLHYNPHKFDVYYQDSTMYAQPFFTPIQRAIASFPCTTLRFRNERNDRLANVFKFQDLNRKKEFYAFLMGRHPVIGVDSPVRKFAIQSKFID